MKYTLGILIILFLSSCSIYSDSLYNWRYDREPSKLIKIKVVEDVSKYCPRGAIACAYRRPDVCVLYFPKEPHELDPYIVQHEVRHCRGWTHRDEKEQ